MIQCGKCGQRFLSGGFVVAFRSFDGRIVYICHPCLDGMVDE